MVLPVQQITPFLATTSPTGSKRLQEHEVQRLREVLLRVVAVLPRPSPTDWAHHALHLLIEAVGPAP